MSLRQQHYQHLGIDSLVPRHDLFGTTSAAAVSGGNVSLRHWAKPSMSGKFTRASSKPSVWVMVMGK
jgi:hypothetical protein